MHKSLADMTWNVATTLATAAAYDVAKSALTSKESDSKSSYPDTNNQISSEEIRIEIESGYESNQFLWMFGS